MTPAIEAIIFDMDGLLVDSEIYWEEARRDYSSDHDCEWTPQDELAVKGNNSAEWAEAIRRRCQLAVPPDVIIDGVVRRMRALYDRRLPLLPGATEIVPQLASGYPLAIASSSPVTLIEYVMTLAGLRDCFTVAVSADEVGRGKPAPDVFLEAARQLGHPPDRCAVFEDSTAGIAAGRAAGMFVIAVPNPHYPPSPEVLQQADIVLGSLTQFRLSMLTTRINDRSS
ncbi:MAG TPA: HAD family phosphatase [Chloroflexota bacterium]